MLDRKDTVDELPEGSVLSHHVITLRETDVALIPPTSESLSSVYCLSISIRITINGGELYAVRLTLSWLSTEGSEGALPFRHGAAGANGASLGCSLAIGTGSTICSLLPSVMLGEMLRS